MKRINQSELNEILRLHGLYLKCDAAGICADLSGCDISWLNMTGANLGGANLGGCNMNGANMRGANLGGASLSWASTIDTSMNGADMTHANMTGANMTRAYMSGANMRGAIGNMREVKSAQFDTWSVTWTTSPVGITTLQIGCQRHDLQWWKAASDCTIAALDESQALAWWRKYRDLVIGLVEASPAVPWGVQLEVRTCASSSGKI